MRLDRTMIFVAAVTLVSMMPIAAWADERRPNVVFFLVDDLGWRDLGC